MLSSVLGAAAPLFASTTLESLRLSTPLEIFLALSALSFLPLLLVSVTTFTRNVIVLSFMRQGLGLQQTPPNLVLIVFAGLLTMVVMGPVLRRSYDEGVTPYLENKVTAAQAGEKAWTPIRDFLLRQTREEDLALVYELSKTALPKKAEAVSPLHLTSAFLLSELRLGFQMGFLILLPFLLVDLVVSAILMSLGMIMVPPVTLSLPLKIMLFVVVDGWALLARTLVSSVAT